MTPLKWITIGCLVAAMGLIVYGSIPKLAGWGGARRRVLPWALVVGLVGGFRPMRFQRSFWRAAGICWARL